MTAKPVLLLCVVLVSALRLQAQEDAARAARYVELIEAGQAEAVREELPSLLEKYPGDPGILYVQALLTPDGSDAVRLYQLIVDNHPRSEWADDALYRIHQFYHAIGLYRTAEMKLAQLRKEYPGSPYAGAPAGAGPGDKTEMPVSSDTLSSASRPPAGQFALQVGAYSTLVNAEKQKLFFEDLGYPVEVLTRVRDGRSLYTVNVGVYATYDEAKLRSAEIKKTYNIDSFVVTR
ncbi:MAG: SPOR domain-containing protein [Bacteroidota bacterium]